MRVQVIVTVNGFNQRTSCCCERCSLSLIRRRRSSIWRLPKRKWLLKLIQRRRRVHSVIEVTAVHRELEAQRCHR